MRLITNIIAAFSIFVLTATSTFGQSNPYGDTHHTDRARPTDNRNRPHRHCTESYSNKLFNRDFAGLANSNMYHLDNQMRSYVKYRCLTSEQIRRLAGLYQTDRDKYEFLTYALNFVYDIEAFGVTGSVLANRNARDAFYRFLVQEGIPAGDYYNTNVYYAGGGGYGYTPPPVYNQPQQPYPAYDNSFNNNNNNGNNYNNNNGNSNGYNNYPDPRNGQNMNPQNNMPNQAPNYNQNNQNQTPQYNNQNQTPQYNNQNQPQINSKGLNSGYQGLMTYQEFSMMKERIKQNAMDIGKLETAKSLLRNNVVTAIQVAEIARLMTFDGNRLDFAKFAFDYTYDRDVYNVVADALTFQKK